MLLALQTPFDHRGPVYLYTYVIFALMAPWCVMLPAALPRGQRSAAHVLPPT